ncbi:MAG: PD40 domain-containing protein [Bacteroidetes bacterium]|nr:PD40 domain-containing protein [Bacteroidota bacterium]
MKIENKFTLLTILFLVVFQGFSQQKNSFEKKFDNAEKIYGPVYNDSKGELLNYSKEEFTVARPLYLELYKMDTTNANVAFKLGVCHLSSRTFRSKSIPYLLKATSDVTDNYDGSSHKERKAPLIAYKFLADAYHLNYQFDKAIEAYTKYKSVMKEENSTDKDLVIETNRKIEMCNTGKILVKTPINVKIKTIGSNANSPFADYSPVISADQQSLYFTSRRPGSVGSLKDKEGNYREDVYKTTKVKNGWSKAVNIGIPINTEDNEASVGISPDGQTILVYKDDNGDGNIYSTSLKGDVWARPVKLNDNINSKHWEPSAFISADGNTMYFTSNRPGGFGERDIYTSKKMPNGDWGKAENMGPSINTKYDEDAPFIHPDGKTFYFSSTAHTTMGGFDIFSSVKSSTGVWSDPMNVGYPINTTDDDVFYVVSPNGLTAYFSSFRKDGIGGKDNYMATFLDRKETPLTLMKGKVVNELGKAADDVEITVTDNETEEIVGVYHTNSKTGEYVFILTPGKNYNITYEQEGHLFYSENMEIGMETNYYEIFRPIMLDPIVIGSKITLNNIFFDFDKDVLRPLSNVEIKNLVKIMNKYPNIKVEISGYTDSKGGDVYNQVLSESRAKAVMYKLIESGISPERMTAKGYGETKPVAANTKVDKTDNPQGRQLNRRVEFKITGI